MRQVDKSVRPAPPSLDQESLGYAAELARNQQIAQMRARGESESFAFRLYSRDDVRGTLEQLFHGKCAYCESRYCGTQPVDVEHFRPKSRVSGVKGFPGYWWLGADWDNLLPSCIDCNRARRQISFTKEELQQLVHDAATPGPARSRARHVQGKADAFPLLDEAARSDGPNGNRPISGERSCLINPTEDGYSFETYFRYDFSSRFKLGVLIVPAGLTPGRKTLDDATIRALQTIETCGLNRLALLQSRHRALVEVDYLIDLFTIAAEGRQIANGRAAELFERQEKMIVDALRYRASDESEYCHMIRAYLTQSLGIVDWSE